MIPSATRLNRFSRRTAILMAVVFVAFLVASSILALVEVRTRIMLSAMYESIYFPGMHARQADRVERLATDLLNLGAGRRIPPVAFPGLLSDDKIVRSYALRAIFLHFLKNA